MDDKTKELMAIAASVSAHCQPCLLFHVTKAKELGINLKEIKEAISVGKTVSKGAMSSMNTFIEDKFNS